MRNSGKFKKIMVKAVLFCLIFVGFFLFSKNEASAAIPGLSECPTLPDLSVTGAYQQRLFAEAAGVGVGELRDALSGAMAIDTSDALVQKINKAMKEQGCKDYQFMQGVEMKKSLGSKLFQTTLSNVLNTLAFDAANWIASGGQGQESAFERRSFGQIALDAVDSAAGEFLYQWGTEGPLGVNLCQPSLGVDLEIGLGLRQYQRPKPACTFSQMRDNWEEELNRPDFLGRFQDYFNPTSNDLGIALSAHTMNLERLAFEKESQVEEAKNYTGGIKPISEMISGLKKTPSQFLYDAQKAQLIENLGDNIGKYTGDALIDALNIFINQLAIQLINRFLQEGLFGGGDSGGSSSGLGALYQPEADVTAESGGVQAAKDRFRKITQPRFNVRGDYNILAELSMCPDPNNVGPTNCVITDNFRQAVQERKTVGQAMTEGMLNAAGAFGFSARNQEPRYQDENYPYRSLIILRKFRILPVGWEVAANYINEHAGDAGVLGKAQLTLKDLVDCFDPCDQYTGFGDGNNNNGNCTAPAPDPNSWCRKLVDPDWVLKAPLNYCARQGYGETLLSAGAGSIQRSGNYCADEQACIKENSDGSCEVYGYCTEERRNWNFGAGSCNPLYNTCQTFYGQEGKSISYLKNTLAWCDSSGAGCRWYSTKYNYGSEGNARWDESEKIYFNRNAEQCDAADEGCREFIRAKAGLGTNLIPYSSFEQWTPHSADPNTIATFEGWSHDSNVETRAVNEGIFGNYAIKVKEKDDDKISYLETNYIVKDKNNVTLYGGHRYILSGYINPNIARGTVYLTAGNHGVSGGFIKNTTALTPDGNNVWQRVYAVFDAPADISGVQVRMILDNVKSGDTVMIDAIQLEEVINEDSPSSYKDYRETNLAYEKELPDYLANGKYYDNNGDIATPSPLPDDGIQGFCYEKIGNSYQSRDSAPAECFNYARRCTESEAGCELYTRVWDGFAVPAKVSRNDYCPAECNGYDLYIQQETTFESPQEQYFIPATARTCGAQADGCDQFTNLDEVEKGGEGIEYYSRLRQCTIGNTNATFYTWEGSEDAGYQLRSFTLQYAGGGTIVTTDDNVDRPNVAGGSINNAGNQIINSEVVCSEVIFNASIRHPAYNPDCRQFYSRAGVITYALFSRTISYDTNCHPYRRTEVNVDYNITQADCTGVDKTDRHWDSGLGVCYLCKNNGQWNNDQQACVYMAIPQQGQMCNAAEAGCRKYVGNFGNNIRNIITDDFNSRAVEGWQAGTDSKVESSNTSLMTNGYSLKVFRGNGQPVEAFKNITYDIIPGRTYILEFLAKSDANHILAIDLQLSQGSAEKRTANIAPDVSVSNEWNSYKYRFTGASLEAQEDTINLRFSSANTESIFYFDYIILREISDNYYSIKYSWNTPRACDQDWEGNSAIHYMSGCYEYSDRDNRSHYLKSFSGICTESAVGCELMIDTQNYTNPDSAVFAGTCRLDNTCLIAGGCSCKIFGERELCLAQNGKQECEFDGAEGLTEPQLRDKYIINAAKVSSDKFVYLAYDSGKSCASGSKGCQRLGLPKEYNNKVISYDDVYLKNNPDKYETTLCRASEIGCEEFRGDSNSLYYFKDPGEQVCEYRDGYFGYDWYKKRVKRCDLHGNNAAADSSAPNGEIYHSSAAIEGGADNICFSNDNCGYYAAASSFCATDAGCAQYGGDFSCIDNKCQKQVECITDTWDEYCPVDKQDASRNGTDLGARAPKTIGYGGSGNRIIQPSYAVALDGKPVKVNWAGLCPSHQSGCTEIIDPMSEPSVNLADIRSEVINQNQEVKLDLNTAYVGSAGINIEGNNKAGFAYLNADNQLIAGTPPNAQNNWLIFSADQNIITLKPTGNHNYFKEAIVNYHIAGNLDRTACGGVPSFNEGCVVFNERSVTGRNSDGTINYNKLAYNAGILTANPFAASTQSLQTCSGGVGCDSNIVLKVSPDRVCDEWLACRSKVLLSGDDGQDELACYNIGVCDGLDENNQCRSWVLAGKNNQTIEAVGNNINYDLDKDNIANMTGYAKVGFYSSAGVNSAATTEGYIPLGEMDQAGDLAIVPNGSFEMRTAQGSPLGWNNGTVNRTGDFLSTGWDDNISKVISNAADAEVLKIDYSGIDGRSFVQLGSSFAVQSEEIEAIQGVDYILTLLVNSANLAQGAMRVKIIGGNGDDIIDNTNSSIDNPVIIEHQHRQGNLWQLKLGKFKVAGGRNSIIIQLYAQGELAGGQSIGGFYFDNIQIRPALEVRDITPANVNDSNFWLTPQSCRLYPGSDALSCDYIDDSGVRQKGWYGYCLENDRGRAVGAYGDPNACLMWWPVDRVKGDGVDEGVGYIDRYPLYYCLDMMVVEKRKIYHAYTSGENNCRHWDQCLDDGVNNGRSEYCGVHFSPSASTKQAGCPLGYHNLGYRSTGVASWGGLFGNDESCDYACYPDEEDYMFTDEKGDKWYVYDGVLFDGKVRLGSHLASDHTGGAAVSGGNWFKIKDELMSVCTKVVQVVSPVGSNKFWAGRVYNGSDYKISVLKYTYNNDYAPFGGAVPPAPSSNPSLWDSSTKAGLQPLSIEQSRSIVRAGSPYYYGLGNKTGSAGRKWTDQIGRCRLDNSICIIGAQTCSDGSTCVQADNTSGVEQGSQLLRRIFARSYGGWEAIYNRTGGATCDAQFQCAYGGATCTTENNNCATGNNLSLTCVDSVYQCLGGVQNGKNCNTSDTETCTEAVKITDCAAAAGAAEKTCASRTSKSGAFCRNDTAKTVVDNLQTIAEDCWGFNSASVCTPVSAEFESESRCVGGTLDGMGCENPSDCANYNGSVCQLTKVCSFNSVNSNAPCSTPADCQRSDNPCLPIAEGICSDNSSIKCYYNSQCSPDASYVRSSDSSLSWNIPTARCWNNSSSTVLPSRPGYNSETGQCLRGTTAGDCTAGCVASGEAGQFCDYCGVPPQVLNIKVDGKNNNIEITGSDFVNLTFTTDVDEQQEPMIAYFVNWGDDETTSVAGVEMRDRPLEEKPHSLYHLYDYWDLKRKSAISGSGITCENSCPAIYCATFRGSYCRVQPKVWIKDNWGWYSFASGYYNAVQQNVAPTGDQMPEFKNAAGGDAWIVVKER